MTSAPQAYAWNPAPLPGQRPRWSRVLEFFLLSEIAFQLALLVPALNVGALRILWRVGIFGISLALMALLPGRTKSSPVTVAAFWIIALLAVEIFNPTSNTWLAAAAETTMYVAILAPLFWISRLEINLRLFRRTLLIFWGYFSLSTFVGILQVLFPGRFQPRLSPMIASMGDAVEGLKIVLANGQRIFRPMGLTDMPGGAASAGMWAVLFGLGFLLTSRAGRARTLKRSVYLATMVMGMMCIYLSQARVMLVIVAVWFASLLAILFWRQRWREFALLGAMVAVIGGGGFYLSLRVGGKSVSNRFASVASTHSTSQTFTSERGFFVSQAFTEMLPRYPLGAGLGRWGMMNTYFGNNMNPNTGLIYVEVQWQGWILDGGIPLLLAYLALLGAAMLMLARIARRRGPLALWAMLCLAYDVSMLAFCFDYTPFTGETGMEFWFINAVVLGAAACLERQMAQAPVPGGWPQPPWINPR